MDKSSINENRYAMKVNDSFSDTNEPRNVDETVKSFEQNASNFLDKSNVKVTSNCKDSTNVTKNDVNVILHDSDAWVENNRNNGVPLKVFSKLETEKNNSLESNQNLPLKYGKKESNNAEQPSDKVELTNHYKNIDLIGTTNSEQMNSNLMHSTNIKATSKSDYWVDINISNCAPLKVFADTDTESTYAQEKNRNRSPKYSIKESNNVKQPSYEVETTNNNINLSSDTDKLPNHNKSSSTNLEKDNCILKDKTNIEMTIKVFAETESTSAQERNVNQPPQYGRKGSTNEKEPSDEVGSTNKYKNANSIRNDISKNQSFLDYLCSKLTKLLVRCKQRPRFSSHQGEAAFDSENYLNRVYLEKSSRTTHYRVFTNFKETMKHLIRPSRAEIRDNLYNPLRRTYQVYFGEFTEGGIDYNAETFNCIVILILLTVVLLLVPTIAFHLFWYESLGLDEWAYSSNDPAVLCVFGCCVILFVDLIFSYIRVARNPIFTWTCMPVVWACVQFIIFYIGVKCRSKNTDNVFILIITPFIVTCGVALSLLWMAVTKFDLLGSYCPYIVTIGGALSMLGIMTGLTWKALLYKVHELVISWIVSLYYAISMLLLLQMILSQKMYEMNEYDVALPAMLLFLSPYTIITAAIRYFVYIAGEE